MTDVRPRWSSLLDLQYCKSRDVAATPMQFPQGAWVKQTYLTALLIFLFVVFLISFIAGFPMMELLKGDHFVLKLLGLVPVIFLVLDLVLWRKIRKRCVGKIPKFAGLGIAVLVIVALVLTNWPPRPTIDRVWLSDTQFQYSDLHKVIDDSFTAGSQEWHYFGHRLQRGNGIILAYRWFRPGPRHVTDMEEFEKVTVWMPSLNEGEFSLGTESKVQVYYSEGSAVWGLGCSTVVNSGKLTIQRVSENKLSVKIAVKGQGSCKWVGGRGSKAIEFTESGVYQKIEFSSLSPWLGIAGTSPMAESYRHSGGP